LVRVRISPRHRPGRCGIGETDAELVERIQPAERTEPMKKVVETGNLPPRLEVAEPEGHKDEIERPGSGDLVGDMDPISPGIPGLGEHARQA
jgi:hypothetical protein